MTRPIKTLILIFFLLGECFAQEQVSLEKIVVSAAKVPLILGPWRKNHSFQSLTEQESSQRNPGTFSEILEYFSGMDLRNRWPGIQADASVKGSTYEQVAVSIDGINLMDPQTGHHNLDIPLTVFDIAGVEMIQEGSSSLYGAGAFAGSVNIVTKKPTEKQLNLNSFFGDYALFGNAISLSLPHKEYAARVSFEENAAKAARPNTDFEYKTGSFYLEKNLDRGSADILFGYQKKDFGADSFYSNLFPEEEEHTETLLVKSAFEIAAYKNTLYLRKHRDKFILRRNNPTSVNYHTTYIYGLDSRYSVPFEFGDLSLGLDLGNDQINSTNLGKHQRLHEAGYLALNSELGEKLDADLSLRLDHYQKWGQQGSYNLGLGYKLRGEQLRLRSSLARAFRLPTFTELYYQDAANKGNPELKTERSDTFTLGLDLQERNFSLGWEAFWRRGENLIDWTRTATSDPWQATNLGKIDFRGIGIKTQVTPGLSCLGLKLKQIGFSYQYIDADKDASGFFSKYALDILKHQYILALDNEVYGLRLNLQLNYQQRYYGETYLVGNLMLSREFSGKDFILEPYIKVDNFTNTKYTEIASVLQPPRWIKGGVKFRW